MSDSISNDKETSDKETNDSDPKTSDKEMQDKKSFSQLYESVSALIDDEVSELELHRILSESEQDPELRSRWHRYQIARAVMRRDYHLDGVVDLSHSVRTAIAGLTPDQMERDSSLSPAEDSSNSPASNAARAGSGWRTKMSRFAIAASVAGLVFVGSQQLNLVAGKPAGTGSQMAESSLSDGDGSMSIYSSPANSAPTTSDRVFTAPANTGMVPMITVSDATEVYYQERPQAQIRLEAQDPRLAEYEQAMNQYFYQLLMEHAKHSAANGSSSLLPYARVPEDSETP